MQSYLGKRVTTYLNDAYGTNMQIKRVDFSFLGNVNLKDIQINDHKNDSLIYVKSLVTSIFNYRNILNNKLELGEVDLEGATLNMITHKGEENDNLSVFVESFDDGNDTPSATPFLLTSSKLNLTNVNFILNDRNKQEEPIVFYKHITGYVKDFKLEGPNVYAKIRRLAFVENHGIEVTNLTTDFEYTKQNMFFKSTKLQTKNSLLNNTIIFSYNRDDLADFNNKVTIEADFKESSLSLIDLNKFYSELGLNDKLNFTTKFTGTLNDFKLNDLSLISNRKSIIDGNLHFKNVANTENGFSLNARFYELSSNYQNLKQLLPNILGKTLPSTFEKLGRFSIAGESVITEEKVNADITIKSALGRTISNLELTNIDDIDNAKYKGNIEFVNFDLSKIVNDSLVGRMSLIADVDGEGFTLEKFNTTLKGNAQKFTYKGYEYTNIDVNGVVKNKLFDGNLTANDENLKMTFKGLADLSSSIYKFDFKTNISHSDFNKLNLFSRDKLAVLKGNINLKLTGNSLDNMAGEVDFKNTSYTNQNNNYFFKDFNITSQFRDSIRILTINSSDIVEGTIKGRFRFNELEKLTKNSIGSIYANYQPEKVTPGQFLDFNFKIYDKIVGVFFPKVHLGANSSLKGKINADNDKFELLVKSPKVDAYENVVEQIRLQIDNKNPLYNTLLSLGKVKTKYYNIAGLNLVNVTLNDTLFFRTDFIGGDKLKEKFDLSFYHTINEHNKSVVGLKTSNINFKGNDWKVNPLNNNLNKVVFDEKLQTFAFDKIDVISGNQKIDFAGVINSKNDKDVNLNLENVKLEGITPKIDSLSLKGLVNGKINYKQIDGILSPIANLSINNFYINNHKQGNLIVDAKGDNSIKKFIVDTSLQNENLQSLLAKGEIDFEPKRPTIIANYTLNKFKLNAFSPLGEDVLNKIRGEISGKGIATGLLSNPDIDGELYLENAGLAFPYLNVDYDFIGKPKITLEKQSFIFSPATLVDVVHDTEAILSGKIWHREFEKWFLDLRIRTDNFLVLNTQEQEAIPYYGTAFIGVDGNATIKGATDELVINVNAKTNPGTIFKVPLSDVSTIGTSKLINFISKTEKGVDQNIVKDVVFDRVKGLTLDIFLHATKDAIAEIVIDKNTGSVLRGTGEGFLNIAINTTGKFEIDGTYLVNSGIYEFRNIIDKDFIVQLGGSVIWTGNPFDAYLNNIVAIYRTSANPKVLLENAPSREIDIDLIANISGQLLNSSIDFDLQIPNSNSLVSSELEFKLNDEYSKMTQFFSLLTSGVFVNLDETKFGFNINAFGSNLLSSKISSVLSNILKSKSDKFQIGLDYDVGQRNNLNTSLNTSDRVGISASGRLGKKIIVTGKASVPVGGNTQSSVVGEVQLELPLNKAETFRAKVYNKPNEVQFAVADEEGYTQGIGLSYRVDFDNGKELKEKIFGKPKKEKQKKKVTDSLKVKRSLINFTSKKTDSISAKKATKN